MTYAKESCRTRLMAKMYSILTASRPSESETSCASVFLCARVRKEHVERIVELERHRVGKERRTAEDTVELQRQPQEGRTCCQVDE